MNLLQQLTSKQRQALAWGAGALVVLLLLFVSPAGNLLQSSLLGGPEVGGKESGLYVGKQQAQSGTGTALVAGTGATLRSDGALYGALQGEGSSVRVELRAHTGEGDLRPNSLTGVVTYDPAVLSASTGSILLPGADYLEDTALTEVVLLGDGSQKGELRFSVDKNDSFTRPYDQAVTLGFDLVGDAASVSDTSISLTSMRYLYTKNLALTATGSLLINTGTTGVTLEPLLWKASGETARETILTNAEGEITITTDYFKGASKTSQRVVKKEAGGANNQAVTTTFSETNAKISEVAEEYASNGVTVVKETTNTFNAAGEVSNSSTKYFNPNGELYETEVTSGDGKKVRSHFFKDGKVQKRVSTLPNGDVLTETFQYYEDGSYDITSATIFASDNTRRTTLASYNDAGEEESSVVLEERAILKDAFTLTSSDQKFTARVPAGSVLETTVMAVSNGNDKDYSPLRTATAFGKIYELEADLTTGKAQEITWQNMLISFDYDQSELPTLEEGDRFGGVEVFIYDNTRKEWIPTNKGGSTDLGKVVFDHDAITSYRLGAQVYKKPNTVAATHVVVERTDDGNAAKDGSGEGFGSIGSVQSTPTSEEISLPSFDDGERLRTFGILNFAPSQGQVLIPVEHVDFESKCSITYAKGTEVRRAGETFTGKIGALKRFEMEQLQSSIRNAIPSGAMALGEFFVQYGSLAEEFTSPVTLRCTIDKPLAEAVDNEDMVRIMGWNATTGVWETVGSAANIQNTTFEVELERSMIVAVLNMSLSSLRPSADTCENNNIPNRTPFRDANNHWSAEFICKLIEKGAVSGYRSGPFAGTFQPDRAVTRAELLKIVLAAEGVDPIDTKLTGGFSDVSPEDWYARYVVEARQRGIVGGYADGTFRPNATVNRAEAIKIIMAASSTISQTDLDEEAIAQAQDSDTIAELRDVQESDWFATYVSLGSKLGIIGGKADGGFNGDEGMTRAEVSKVVSLLSEVK